MSSLFRKWADTGAGVLTLRYLKLMHFWLKTEWTLRQALCGGGGDVTWSL